MKFFRLIRTIGTFNLSSSLEIIASSTVLGDRYPTIPLVRSLDFPHELPAFDNVEVELIPQAQRAHFGPGQSCKGLESQT
jgi:hypothetical protein